MANHYAGWRRCLRVALRAGAPIALFGFCTWFFGFTHTGGELFYTVLGGLIPFLAVVAGALLWLATRKDPAQVRSRTRRVAYGTAALALVALVAGIILFRHTRPHVLGGLLGELLLLAVVGAAVVLVGAVKPDLLPPILLGERAPKDLGRLPVRALFWVIEESPRKALAALAILLGLAMAGLVAILIAVVPAPNLRVANPVLDFGTTEDSMHVRILPRQRGASVAWSVVVPDDAQSFLSVTPQSGVASPDAESVLSIRVERPGVGCQSWSTTLTLDGGTFRKAHVLVLVSNDVSPLFSDVAIDVPAT